MKSTAANLIAVVASSTNNSASRADLRQEVQQDVAADPFAHLISGPKITAGSLRQSALVSRASLGAGESQALPPRATPPEHARALGVRANQEHSERVTSEERPDINEPPHRQLHDEHPAHKSKPAKESPNGSKKEAKPANENSSKQPADEAAAEGSEEAANIPQEANEQPAGTDNTATVAEGENAEQEGMVEEAAVAAAMIVQDLLLVAQIPALTTEPALEGVVQEIDAMPQEIIAPQGAPAQLPEEAQPELEQFLSAMDTDAATPEAGFLNVLLTDDSEATGIQAQGAQANKDAAMKMLAQVTLLADQGAVEVSEAQQQAADTQLVKNLAALDERKSQGPATRAVTEAVMQAVQPMRGAATIAGTNLVAPLVIAAADTASTQSGLSNQNQSSSGQQGQNASSVNGASGVAANDRAREASAGSFAKVLHGQAHAPVEEQVSLRIKTAIRDGSSRITMHLQPAELGRLDIRLDVGSDGKAQLMITAEHKSTLELLQKDVRGLERALNDAGVSTDAGNMNFNLRGEQQNGQDAQRFAESYARLQPEAEIEDETLYVQRQVALTVTDGLDITI